MSFKKIRNYSASFYKSRESPRKLEVQCLFTYPDAQLSRQFQSEEYSEKFQYWALTYDTSIQALML